MDITWKYNLECRQCYTILKCFIKFITTPKEKYYKIDVDVSLSVCNCLWHRNSQTDGPLLMRFLLIWNPVSLLLFLAMFSLWRSFKLRTFAKWCRVFLATTMKTKPLRWRRISESWNKNRMSFCSKCGYRFCWSSSVFYTVRNKRATVFTFRIYMQIQFPLLVLTICNLST